MEAIAGILTIWAILWVVGWLRGLASSATAPRRVDLADMQVKPLAERMETTSHRDPGVLSVKLRPDSLRLEGGSEALPVLRVQVSGSLRVPVADKSVKFVVRLLDEITLGARDQAKKSNGADVSMPVFCMIPAMSDANGGFLFEQEFDLPYESCGLNDLDLVRIPLFALVGARSGQRQLRVVLLVVSQRNEKTRYGGGTNATSVNLVLPGYEELAERTAHRDKQIAQLALSLAAADGRIDKRETAHVRRFFAERNASLDNDDERSQKIDQLMNEAMQPFRDGGQGGHKLKELMGTLCSQLVEDGDDSVKQTAYELAVKVVAADEVVDEREQQALRFVAERLDLPAGFVKEVHDRNLRANMYSSNDTEMLLGIPPGMSAGEKKEFLSSEYRKWRSRVTHSDAQVAAEASVRLQQIAKARAALGDG